MRLPARVDWVEHERTGIKVALRLNKKSMKFQAEYGGQTYMSKDGAEVRALVLDAIERSHRLTFQPVIRVEVAGRGNLGSMYLSKADLGAGLILAVTRFYFSQEGGLRSLSWEDFEANNVNRLRVWSPWGFKGKPEEFILPFAQCRQRDYGSDYHHFPYSEGAWEGLQRIVALVEALKDRLDAFLRDPDVVANLVAGEAHIIALLGDDESQL